MTRSHSPTPMPASSTSARAWMLLCFLIAMIEGFDIQAAGVAAPRLAPALGLGPEQKGLFFSAATLGLIAGALIGGRLADRIGRKATLVGALLMFGVFSIGTALAYDFPSLITVRFLTGLGIGGAMPGLVAIVAEVCLPQRRGAAVATLYAGMPAGGAIASLLAAATAHSGWQLIFMVGGIAPLLVVPALLRATAPQGGAHPVAQAERPAVLAALFGPDYLGSTLLLWVSFFCALVVHGLLLNWLPSLLVSRGLAPAQAGQVQILFNIAGAIGSLIAGRAMDALRPRYVVTIAFLGLMGALVLMAMVPSVLALTFLAGFLVGLAGMGVQGILYGLAPRAYPTVVRGTGVGAAMAVGRFGSFVGPLAAGGLIAAGGDSTRVLICMLPVALVSAIATLLLVGRADETNAKPQWATKPG